MKELKGYQTELLINYLKERITFNRNTAKEMTESQKYTHAAIYESRADELDCALTYLMGLLHGEG